MEDPLSKCEGCNPPANGENAISARSDLNPANGTYPFGALEQRSHGGTDMKVFFIYLEYLDAHLACMFACSVTEGDMLMNCLYSCVDDLLRDVPSVWHGGSEWANLGPGASFPVEHFPLQRLDSHGSP